MNFIKFSAIAAVISVMALTTSCSNDVSVLENEATLKNEGLAAARGIIPGQAQANGNWVVSGIKVFFDGYYRPFSSLPSQFQLNNTSGTVNSSYAVGGRSFNGSYYILGDTKSTGKRGILKLDGSLGGDQFLPSVPNSGNIRGQQFEVNFTLFDASTGYYTDVQKSPGNIYMFNPSTMVKSNRVFRLAGQVGGRIPDFRTATYKHIGGKLLIRRGDKIFADITYGNSLNRLKQVIQADNNIRVAVINARSGRVERILKGAKAQNIGLFNDHPLVNIDPVTKDIYFATVGNMVLKDQPKNTSQIFKIDGGNNISSVVGYQDVAPKDEKTGKPAAGEFNRLYVYNGVIYTTIANGSVRYISSGGSHTFENRKGNKYRNNIWKWSTIQGGKATPIKGIKLEDNFYAYQQPTLINREIYFIVNNSSYAGVHKSRVYKVPAGGTTATLATKAKGGLAGWGLASPNKISSINKL